MLPTKDATVAEPRQRKEQGIAEALLRVPLQRTANSAPGLRAKTRAQALVPPHSSTADPGKSETLSQISGSLLRMPATSRRIFRHSTNKSTKKGIQAIKIPEPSSSPLTENSPPILSPRSATSTSSPIHRMSTRSMGRQEKILGTIASLAKAPQEKQDCCKVQDSQQCHAAITPLLDDQEPLAIDTTLNSMPANPMQNKTSASTDKPTPVEQVGVETLKQVHDVNTQQPIPQGPVSRSHPEVMAFQSTSSQLISELSSSSHDIAQDSASQCAAMGLSSAGSDSQCSDSDLSSEPGRYDEVKSRLILSLVIATSEKKSVDLARTNSEVYCISGSGYSSQQERTSLAWNSFAGISARKFLSLKISLESCATYLIYLAD